MINRVKKTTPEQEQQFKDESFLRLTPQERLQILEQLRRRIWRDRYNRVSYAGMRVVKKTLD